MRLEDLYDFLSKMRKSDPASKDAEVWAYGSSGMKIHIQYVGYDTKHKPARVKLED